MELIFDIVNYITTIIILGICGAWMYLLKCMIDSFRLTPYLDRFENKSKDSVNVLKIIKIRMTMIA